MSLVYTSETVGQLMAGTVASPVGRISLSKNCSVDIFALDATSIPDGILLIVGHNVIHAMSLKTGTSLSMKRNLPHFTVKML